MSRHEFYDIRIRSEVRRVRSSRSITNGNDGNRPEVIRQIQNFPHIFLFKRASPTGAEAESVGRKQQVLDARSRVLDAEQGVMIDLISEQQVNIRAGHAVLEGLLTFPAQARAGVIFAHGSGSSRLSPLNRFVADILVKAGFATLLFDPLTPKEDADYDNRFNIDLLTGRLMSATLWLRTRPQTSGLSLGYFGASTGTASALRAASEPGTEIKAVVSRGGRPDLAGDALSRVRAPVLLIVGGLDHPVIDLNRQAYKLLGGEKEVAIVPGATHLFEEPGALDEVARLASPWFTRHLLPAV